MTLAEAIAAQPAWIGLWLNWLLFGAFILPLALLIWRPTRLAAVLTVAASVAGAVAVNWMYGEMGYVRLLGLPHIVLWTPLAVYLWRLIRREDVTVWAKRVLAVVLGTILISLAFDYTDAIRYALGERTPAALPAE
ncbi:MAG: hypothetical protein AAGE76_00655 [Pseudomonadota bacterium]